MIRPLAVVLSAWALSANAPTVAHAIEPIPDFPFAEYDLMMFERPALPNLTSSTSFQPGLKELWLKALEQPDPELQRLVIDTIAIAHRRGVKDLASVGPRLVELAKDPESRLDVRRAVANTLVVLDANEHAAFLGELAMENGPAISQFVEPALIRWKSPVLEKPWLERLNQGNSPTTTLVFAIRGLAATGNLDAVEPLKAIALNPAQNITLRMESAQGLGTYVTEGLVDDARKLSELSLPQGNLNSILAVKMLGQHVGPRSVELLSDLASHESTAVQSLALRRLLEIDNDSVAKRAETLIQSPDVNVRRCAFLSVIEQPSVQQVGLVASLLDDVNPSLRAEARDALIDLHSSPELADEVIAKTTEVLRADSWRGCEQACVVMTRLGHKESGARMVELLAHDREDVMVASAWGLSKLRIKDLLPDMFEHATRVLERYRSGELNDSAPTGKTGPSISLAHLFLAFGDQQYEPASELLREYIPKNHDLGVESRAAAAWALGMIYQDQPQQDLIKLFVGRISDGSIENPETSEMQQMSAIAIGLMKGESGLDTLRKFANASGINGLACYWAIQQITGEAVPPPKHIESIESGWFLEPILVQDGD